MAATARVIWLWACVRYWPYHGVGSVRFSPEICHFTVMDGSEADGDLVCFVMEIVLEKYYLA